MDFLTQHTVVPLVVLGFGGYLLVTGIRQHNEPCDQPLAQLLIALGSFLVAPFILACLFIPAFLTGTGADTEDMLVRGGVLMGIADLLAFLITLIITTVDVTETEECNKTLYSAARNLMMGAWAVMGTLLVFSITFGVTRTTSGTSRTAHV